MPNPPKNDTPDKAQALTLASEYAGKSDWSGAYHAMRAAFSALQQEAIDYALSQPQPAGLVEADLLDDIATMMSEFVENWPSPKKAKTALALIAKTIRAALSNSPVVGEDQPHA